MKAKRGKCLALVAVLAMVVCAFAVFAPSDVSATESEMVITISDDESGVKFVKDGTDFTPDVVGNTYVLTNTNELTGCSKIKVNMTGGTIDKPVAIVNYKESATFNGSIEFNMTGGTLNGGIYMAYTHGFSSMTAGTWGSPIKMASNVTANISAGTIKGAIQPVINYLSIDNYTINVSGSADIAVLKTAGSNGKIGNEVVNITGGKVGYITAQRSAVTTLTYNISGGEIAYFTIGADIEGANNTSAEDMQTGFVTGDVNVTIASAAKVDNAIIGGGILDMPKKNANNNDIGDVTMAGGKLVIDAPGKTIKLQNSFYDAEGKVAILYTYPTITHNPVNTATGLTIADFWNGENVFGNSTTGCKELVLKDGTLSLPSNGGYYGTISNGDNKVLLGVDAGGFTISKGSIVIGGELSTSSNGNSITVVSGTAKINVNAIPAGVTINVNSNAKLEIPEGMTVTNNGNITNNGTLVVNGSLTSTPDNVTGTGAVAVKAGVDASQFTTITNIISTSTQGGSFGMSEDLESDYTVKTSAFLENNLTVPEGTTLTIEGNLELNGKTLTVYGTLNVTKKGQVQAIGGGSIVLGKTGAIVNNGIIGYESVVTVKDQKVPASSVTTKNVVGVNFALTKEVTVYTLTVSGDVSKKGSNNAFTINNAYITDLNIKDFTVGSLTATVLKDGSLTIGSKATVTTINVIMKSSTITVDGTISAGYVHMTTGSVANVNGIVGKWTDSGENATFDGVEFCAKAGSFNTYANDKRQDPEADGVIANESKIVLKDITGVTIEVTSKAYTVGTTAKTEQMLNVYGAPSFNKDKTDGSITPTNKVYVPTGKELSLAKNITADITAGKFVTQGTLKSYDEIAAYIGASYSMNVETETGKVAVYYYTTFDAAYAVIADAEDMSITVKGDLAFSKEYTVAADQTITLDSTATNTIAKSGKVTVEADGTLSGDFTVANPTATPKVAAGIQGILVVKDGGACTPASGSYEVSSKDADNNMTYSGAAVAIENAVAGSTIYITNDVIFADKTTIPADVTVDVASGATVTAQKGLVVNGKIVNNGTVDVTGDLEVNGIVDNNGTFTASEEATVKGTFMGDLVGTTKINAAKYDNGEETIFTTVEAALEAVAKMDVPVNVDVLGKVSETSDVTLVDGMTLFIKGEVTLKSIRLVTGSTLDINTVNAKLTADIIGAVGKADTTGAVADAVVDVSKLEKGEFKLTYSEATSASTMTMKLDATYEGAVVIETGEVALAADNADLTFNKDTTLTIASGATLVLNKDGLKFINADDGKYLAIDGKIDVKKSMTFDKVTVSGQVVVAVEKVLTLKNATVVGDIVLSEKEGKDPASVLIDTKITVGTNPKNLGASAILKGKINMGTGYALVFAGSTFETTVKDVPSTKYSINGIEFATIFGDADITAINDEVIKLKNIDAKKTSAASVTPVTYNFDWYAGSTKITSEKVGAFTEVTSKIAYKGVAFKISAGPGILVYIDDIKVDTTGTYTIGTHKITAYLEPSYEGSITMTINGKAITNGQFEVTTDMLGGDNIIVLAGATPSSSSPTVIVDSDKDDGMSLTDILLIVLVVLIAVMAIMVALRLMRS